jgi:hypothetical protein
MFDLQLQPPYDITPAPLCTGYNTGSVLPLCLIKTIIYRGEVVVKILGNGKAVQMSLTPRIHKSRVCHWPAHWFSLTPLLLFYGDSSYQKPRYLWWPEDSPKEINLLDSNMVYLRLLHVKCDCPIFLRFFDVDSQIMLAFTVPPPPPPLK